MNLKCEPVACEDTFCSVCLSLCGQLLVVWTCYMTVQIHLPPVGTHFTEDSVWEAAFKLPMLLI